MYLTDEILDKLNARRNIKVSSRKAEAGEKITLPDIMVRSFAQVKELAGDTLSWGEKNFLYQQAQEELKENKMAESRILSRANTQLANAVRLGIRQSSMLHDYDQLFPQRASSFVKPGSVASMFSPAGYLTELYREAKGLHADTSTYHLDARRPDLATLALSQNNMDEELSTLSLSNELLMDNIQSKSGQDYDGVLKMLAAYRQTGSTPFHQPYEAVRQAILLQDPEFDAFRNNPSVVAKVDTASLLGIQADVSPELRTILTEEITEDNADALIKKNFGDIDVTRFQKISYLAHWYGLPYDEMSSLLSLVTSSGNIATGVQHYQNDQLVALNSSNGALVATLIKREYYSNSDLNWIEVIPVGDETYSINLSFKNVDSDYNSLWIGSSRDGRYSYDIVSDDEKVLIANKTYSYTHKLTADDKGLFLWVGRYNSNMGMYYEGARVNFIATDYNFGVFLLKLNKLIRLYKATGISPSDIRTVLESDNDNNDLTITDTTLSRLFRVNYYMQTYGIDVDAAMVLAGANISQISHGNQASAFDRLFNTPLLSNTTFYADNAAISLVPGSETDTLRTGILKRAFSVSDTELYTLWSLRKASGNGGEPGEFSCNIDNLSDLWRIKLLADVHGLSVTELAALISVSPWAERPLRQQNMTEVVSFVAQYTQWLKEQGWTVSDLYLMLTDRFNTTLSPDIDNLLTTLINGLANQDLNKSDESDEAYETMLIAMTAPLIAAAMQLDSAEMAGALLQWLSQLRPRDLTVGGFLTLAGRDDRAENETSDMVAYCQVMGQLALFARSAGLNAAELLWVTEHPTILAEKATVLAHNVATLHDITELHAFLARCGTHASEILTSLSGDAKSVSKLSVRTVAAALALDEQALSQALAQCSEYEYFYSWIHLRDALQWLDVAGTLSVTPADVARLIALTNSSPYKDWKAVSLALQAGLTATQTGQLNAALEPSLGAAASAYVIKNIAPPEVTHRDDLYGWLLIDNQVSAQVKTTRIAEAIASVQLYVNRALSGLESGVDSAVKSKTFFTADWDRYNKRYSTWAGLSQLVYYPENYVDPTMRLGQTGMMDEMLQSLSQSQLTSDTVEEAFRTYMTRFEEIANLDVISGYHDSISDKNGITYIIGRSAIGDYYWRSADVDKMTDGKLPANAWSEWKKITTALTPFNNLVRPVIFQSRLYLVWVESREVAATADNNTTTSTEYLLKYAHILHDGTWSNVQIHGFKEIDALASLDLEEISAYGMYCTYNIELDGMTICFYKTGSTSNECVFTIYSSNANTDQSNYKKAFLEYIDAQLKNTDDDKSEEVVPVSLQYPGESITVYQIKDADVSWGEGNYIYPKGLDFEIIQSENKSDGVHLRLNSSARMSYQGQNGDGSRLVVDLMVRAGRIGDTFIIPEYIWGRSQNRQSDFGSIAIKNEEDESLTVFINTPRFLNGIHVLYSGASEGEFNLSANKEGIYSFTISSEVYKGFDFVYEFEPAGGDGIGVYYIKPDNYIEINSGLSRESMKMLVQCGEKTYSELPAKNFSSYSWTDTEVQFEMEDEILIPTSAISNGLLNITLKFSGERNDGLSAGQLTTDIILAIKQDKASPNICVVKTKSQCQYIQYGAYRIRVNTLFAKQLVARANAGLDTVFSMDTQQLKEPVLGNGVYVDLALSPYDASVHGDSGEFEILMRDVFTDEDSFTIASGTLDNIDDTYVNLFLPRLADAYGNIDHLYICAKYQSGKTANILIKKNDKNVWELDSGFNDGTFRGLEKVVLRNDQNTEPMDFNGANALYFWEMFYYVPMMVFRRLLSESRFTEATQWIKYIWNPDGYLVNGKPAPYTWNVRPLEEEISWHAHPLDSVDPDAVAQADPLHYKVATFMAYLDLLIARGDAAYRQLERDTLNEAKMWYVQALNVLGDEPYLSWNSGWPSPRLTDAADETTQSRVQQALLAVRRKTTGDGLRTANTLTNLFLPQQNEKLAGYWQTLAQRLYNLRHNLSIDGNPLTLAIYAAPADPAALLSAAVNSASGGSDLPAAVMPLYRFPVILESARGMVSQLMQFGSTLQGITERQDAEALSELLQTQGSELVRQGIALQTSTLSEIDAEKTTLEESRSGAQSRLNSYSALYDEDVSGQEEKALNLRLAASGVSAASKFLFMSAAAAEMVPNIYGMAVGGSRYGALFNATAIGMQIASDASQITSDGISQKEMWRRRRQEWEIQRNNAESEVKQIDAQLKALAVRREGAVLQKTYLETQQSQTQAQMAFLQNRFTSKALYSWLRGKLAAIYYQFYDLSVSRCLMAQEAYRFALNVSDTYIRPGAWQGTYAGLMAGETLMLNLAQMEQSWLQKDQREKEVTRTVCLSEVYAGLGSDAFVLATEVANQVNDGRGNAGTDNNKLAFDANENQLQATLKLEDLKIGDDYPMSLGTTRRIKQISVTLPALTGPYQDVRAVLSYGGSVRLHQSCQSAAVSHGMNDSGQFQLDFNDARWLPFEGIPVEDSGTLTLSFPQANTRQKALLLTLTDIILHIRYTISGTNQQ